MTLGQVFSSTEPAVQKGLKTAILTQAFQQCSGINAVSSLPSFNPREHLLIFFFVRAFR